MGIFAGDLRFTVYRGTNLIRMDAIASTREKWVAYKYEAGLGGLSSTVTPRVAWRDTGGHDTVDPFVSLFQVAERLHQIREDQDDPWRERTIHAGPWGQP